VQEGGLLTEASDSHVGVVIWYKVEVFSCCRGAAVLSNRGWTPLNGASCCCQATVSVADLAVTPCLILEFQIGRCDAAQSMPNKILSAP
jgi:hypothetical protein